MILTFTRRGLQALALLLLTVICASQAYAATCAPATSQGASGPASWQSYCWIDMSTYNAAQVFGAGQPFSITLSDGSTVNFTLSATTTNAGTLQPVAVPSWSGSAFGNNAFIGIPGLPVLYTSTNGGNVTLTFNNITVTPPAGVVSTGQFKFVVGDGESTNGAEQLNYTTNGGNWTVVDQVANGAGTVYPPSNGIGTQNYQNTGVASPAGAWVVGTLSPTTVTAQLLPGGKQGIVFAIQYSTITVNKVISGSRADPADQFTYGVYGTANGATVLQGTSTGTGAGPFTPSVATLSSGVAVTIKETMAAGSVSNLGQYTSNLTCTNSTSLSPTVLPSNQPITSYNMGNSAYGDAIACTFTNSAKPATLAIQKITSGAIGGPFSFTSAQLASAPAAITTTATGTATPAAPTAINIPTLNAAVTITETPAANFSISAVSCTDTNSSITGKTGTFGTFAGNVVTVPAANVVAAAKINCVITNSLGAATPTVFVQKTTTGATGGPFNFSVTNMNSAPAGITTLSIGTPYPTIQTPIAVNTTGSNVQITETPATNFTINSASCIDTNFAVSGNPNTAFGTLVGNQLTILGTNVKAQARIVCTFDNLADPVIPRVAVQKITTGAFGGPFTFSATNLTGALAPISTTAAATATPASPSNVTVTTTVNPVTITETTNGSFNFTTASCVDTNFAVSTNPSTPFGTLSGTQITIPALNLKPNARIVCTFTNGVKMPTVAIQKITAGAFGGPFTFTAPALSANPGPITTTVAGTAEPASPTAIAANAANATAQITEAVNAGFNVTSATCVDANASFTGNPVSFGTLAGNVLTIDQTNMKPAAQITCTFTNTAKPATVAVRKITTGGFGGTFSFNVANLASAPANITTTATATPAPASPTSLGVNALNSIVQISENTNLAYTFTTASCTDANSGVTGSTGTFGTMTGLLLTIPANKVLPAAQIICTFTNATKPASVAIQKSTATVAGGPFNFTTINLASAPAAITTASPATPTPTAPTAVAVTALNTDVTVTEGASAFTLTGVSCSDANASNSGNPPSFGTLSGSALLIPAANVVSNAKITCVLTNTPITPTVAVKKITTGAIGGPFSFTHANLASAPASVTTVTAGTAAPTTPTTVNVLSYTAPVTLTESIDPSFTISTANCIDVNNTVSGNPATTFGTLAGQQLTVPIVNIKPAAQIVCTFTNTANAPKVTLAKTIGGTGRLNAADQFTLTALNGATSVGTVTTAGAATSASFNFTGVAGTTYTMNEAMAAGSVSVLASYTKTVACNNSFTFGTNTTTLHSLPILLPTQGGDIITCTITNYAGTPNLSVEKSATITGASPVSLGQTITYTYKIKNTGTVPMTGIKVRDMHGTPATQVPLGNGPPAPWPGDANGITNETQSIDVSGGASCDTGCGGTANDGIWATLAPGDEITFTWVHIVTQAEIDKG